MERRFRSNALIFMPMRHAKQSGFTLLELMAVVLLIGIIVGGSMLVFSAGGPQVQFRKELERFMASSTQVGDLSIITGEQIGLVLTPPLWQDTSAEDPLGERGWSYSWKRLVEIPLQDGQGFTRPEWLDIEGLGAVMLPADVQLFVHVDGAEWDWKATPKHTNPMLYIQPTGEVEPYLFEIEFAHDDLDIEPQHIKLNQSGKLVWVEAEADRQALEARF